MIPVKEPHRISSAYGIFRKLPNGQSGMHEGVDIVSDSGSKELYSVCDGEVIDDRDDYDDTKRWTDKHDSVGNRIIVESQIEGKTYYIAYYHMDKNIWDKGDKIIKGQVIGSYADVGISYGAHVHLQCWDKNWKVVNPMFLLNL